MCPNAADVQPTNRMQLEGTSVLLTLSPLTDHSLTAMPCHHLFSSYCKEGPLSESPKRHCMVLSGRNRHYKAEPNHTKR